MSPTSVGSEPVQGLLRVTVQPLFCNSSRPCNRREFGRLERESKQERLRMQAEHREANEQMQAEHRIANELLQLAIATLQSQQTPAPLNTPNVLSAPNHGSSVSTSHAPSTTATRPRQPTPAMPQVASATVQAAQQPMSLEGQPPIINVSPADLADTHQDAQER